MRIVGFGDSFITKNHGNIGYLDMVGEALGAEVDWRGHQGTGPWDAFFQFKDYPYDIDVAVFAWSSPARLYHPHVQGLCHGSAFNEIDTKMPNYEIWEAARQYYYYLYDWRKTEYEAIAFYQWFDKWSERFANIKFIHMWSFSKDLQFNESWEKYKKSMDILEYHHRWSNGVEIRPALIHLSARDGWPTDNDLTKENRPNHLSEMYHRYLSENIVDAVKNYTPGKLYAPK